MAAYLPPPGGQLFRSYLYAPADRERHVAKAYASEADAVVLELEDGVAPDRKVAARRAMSERLAEPVPKPTFVRVNALGSEHLLADLKALADRPVAGIRLPKAEDPATVRATGDALDAVGSSAGLVLLLESALSIERVGELLRAHDRVVGAGLGEQDLAADLGVSEEYGLAYVRGRLVTALAAMRLTPPVQSVWTDLGDTEGLRRSSEQGRGMGFVGRSAIHPDQLAAINAAYTPSPTEVARAREVEEALEAGLDAGHGGVRLPDGRFVDAAVARAAQRTLALAASADPR